MFHNGTQVAVYGVDLHETGDTELVAERINGLHHQGQVRVAPHCNQDFGFATRGFTYAFGRNEYTMRVHIGSVEGYFSI